MDYTKIGNRHYKIDEGQIIKASYNEDEELFNDCGSFNTETFINDLNEGNINCGNTLLNAQEIITQFSIDGELNLSALNAKIIDLRLEE